MRNAIYNEIFLELYEKWRPGIYFSKTTGIVSINGMHTKFLENAIQDLIKRRDIRFSNIMNLEDDNDIISEIKNDYLNQKDVISLKILELQEELKKRVV